MEDIRSEQRAWLRQVLEETKLTPTGLAKRAGLAQTTITNFLNNEDYPHALSARTLDALARVTRRKFGDAPSAGAAEKSEAVKFVGNSDTDPLVAAVQGLARSSNQVEAWVLRSNALEGAGFLPGDILLVDTGATPQPGDIVCAQAYLWRRFTPETIFRIYEPHFLLSKSFDRETAPLLAVDNQNVKIAGVVIASLRPRQARKVAA